MMDEDHSMERAVYLDLDGAWPPRYGVGPRIDARTWGPQLRYLTRAAIVNAFYREVVSALPAFVLYGSGDFHHLTAALLRRIDQPVTVVCFDNHPDWDIRPPKWACGAWVNRALELALVQSVAVWGCGNFELAFPSRLFGNRAAQRSGRLAIYAWAERQLPQTRRHFASVTAVDWRDRFGAFVKALDRRSVYVSIDLDCLRVDDAVTNWENGLFTAEDIAWALTQLRQSTTILGGDVCGAWSEPLYASQFQRLAGWWDHPRVPARLIADARRVNTRSLDVIWPALVTQ